MSFVCWIISILFIVQQRSIDVQHGAFAASPNRGLEPQSAESRRSGQKYQKVLPGALLYDLEKSVLISLLWCLLITLRSLHDPFTAKCDFSFLLFSMLFASHLDMRIISSRFVFKSWFFNVCFLIQISMVFRQCLSYLYVNCRQGSVCGLWLGKAIKRSQIEFHRCGRHQFNSIKHRSLLRGAMGALPHQWSKFGVWGEIKAWKLIKIYRKIVHTL